MASQEMKMETFKELVKCCMAYDPFTMFIVSYWQEQEAIKRNRLLTEKFNDLMQEVWKGYDRGIPMELTNCPNYEERLEAWLWCDGDRGITVVQPEGVPGGRYFEPGWEDANDNVPDVLEFTDEPELPFK